MKRSNERKAIDLPPKIPQAVIQYAKDHDYLPDEFKDINSDNAYTYIKRFQNYKGYEVYRLGIQRNVIAILDYKNCHIILGNYILFYSSMSLRAR